MTESRGITIGPGAPEVINGRMRMTGDRLLIKPLEWNEHGDVSRIVAVERTGNVLRGRVVEAGPGIHPVSKRTRIRDGQAIRIDYSKRFQPTVVQVGDIVELGGLNQFDGRGYSFPQVIYNGVLHIIATERDVAIVRDDLKSPYQHEHGDCA